MKIEIEREDGKVKQFKLEAEGKEAEQTFELVFGKAKVPDKKTEVVFNHNTDNNTLLEACTFLLDNIHKVETKPVYYSKKIAVIKFVRLLTRWGLKDSKEYVEKYIPGYEYEEAP